jgi:hypothetical protein
LSRNPSKWHGCPALQQLDLMQGTQKKKMKMPLLHHVCAGKGPEHDSRLA